MLISTRNMHHAVCISAWLTCCVSANVRCMQHKLAANVACMHVNSSLCCMQRSHASDTTCMQVKSASLRVYARVGAHVLELLGVRHQLLGACSVHGLRPGP